MTQAYEQQNGLHFLWDDPDQWSQITRTMVDQMNPWILVESELIGWFEWCNMIRVIWDH